MSVQAVSMQAPPPPVAPAVQRSSSGDAPTPAPVPASNAAAEVVKAAPVEAAKPTAKTDEQLEQAVEAVKKFLQPISSNLDFSIDKETGIKVVKVVDSITKEVIRQIPSEEMLQIAQALDRLQGLLIRQQA